MVEQADVFQDVSTLNNTSFMQQMLNSQSFKKVLPTHSQLQDEDDELMKASQEDEAPHFGTSAAKDSNPVSQDINNSLNAILKPGSLAPA
jgi:hypothetical protein